MSSKGQSKFVVADAASAGVRSHSSATATLGSCLSLDGQPVAALLAASVRDVLVRIDKVCAITGLSVPTIYRLMSQNKFPRSVKITTTARAWRLSEVTAWVESREGTS